MCTLSTGPKVNLKLKLCIRYYNMQVLGFRNRTLDECTNTVCATEVLQLLSGVSTTCIE